MAFLKRIFRVLFARAEAVFDWSFGQRNSPLANLGSLGWYFFWIVAGTGIYLYVFFDTGINAAYASVEYITNDQWYAAGVMRSLHRYASDALVIVVFLHILREFSLDRLRGKRFFAWLTGVPALWFIYVCGITGYWLVWDKLAQYVAISTSEWLDTLPFFGEPIANNFLNSSTLGGRFFTLMVFMHIFAPLFMLFLMWIHIQRHARARVNPPRPLAIGTAVTLLVLSLVYPAVSQGPADLDVVPASLNLDWYYLAAYPLLDVVPGGQLWLILVLGSILLALMPWLPPAKPAPVAVVSLDNCNGCSRCFEDCPYGAITMAPRSDGLAFATEAVVNADNCLSCGICVGACPTSTPFRRASAIVPGIELPDHPIAGLREQTIDAAAELDGDSRVLIYACDHSAATALNGDNTRVITIPCVA
ncbi:MAG: cytochrome b N-terminal domain-containing protein, partial [Woeseiaceae bacterium]